MAPREGIETGSPRAYFERAACRDCTTAVILFFNAVASYAPLCAPFCRRRSLPPRNRHHYSRKEGDCSDAWIHRYRLFRQYAPEPWRVFLRRCSDTKRRIWIQLRNPLSITRSSTDRILASLYDAERAAECDTREGRFSGCFTSANSAYRTHRYSAR